MELKTWCEHCGAIQEVQGSRCLNCGRNLLKLYSRIFIGIVLALTTILPFWLAARYAPTPEQRTKFRADRTASFQAALLQIDPSQTLFENWSCHIELYIGDDDTIVVVTDHWYSLDKERQMAIVHQLSQKLEDIIYTTHPWRLEDGSGKLLGGHGAFRGDYLAAD